MSIARAPAAFLLCLSLGACAAPTASATPPPTASATPQPTASPTPAPSSSATPIGAFDWPTDSAIALTPGRYSSSPPFDVQFTIDIPADNWGSAHLHGEFFDFMDVTQLGVQPTRWAAFAHPDTIGGGDDAVPAQDLSPRAAAEVLASVENVVAGPISEARLAGLAGVRLDLATDVASTPVFGGSAGQFGLDPAYEARVTILPHSADGDLFLVLVLAPTGQLDAAWSELEPILATIRF